MKLTAVTRPDQKMMKLISKSYTPSSISSLILLRKTPTIFVWAAILIQVLQPNQADLEANLALHKPSWAGGGELLYPAGDANDGDLATFAYYFTYGDPCWWLVDLETKTRSVTAQVYVDFIDTSNPPVVLTIDVFMEDPRNWTDFSHSAIGTVCPHTKIGSGEGRDFELLDIVCPESTEVRFLRLMITEPTTYYNLYEVDVYGDTSVAAPALVTKHAFHRVSVYPSVQHVPAVYVEDTSSKLSCARLLARDDSMDGFEWDPASNVCYLYNDAEGLYDRSESSGGQQDDPHNVYIRQK